MTRRRIVAHGRTSSRPYSKIKPARRSPGRRRAYHDGGMGSERLNGDEEFPLGIFIEGLLAAARGCRAGHHRD
jgi:hypothetical protein